MSTQEIDLYTTYFISDNLERQRELDFCLSKNSENELFGKIYVFLDDKTHEHDVRRCLGDHFCLERVICLGVGGRPSYNDWLTCSRRLSVGISLFANADIFFDESVRSLGSYLKRPKSVVALSRHDFADGSFVPHPKPHWSQDAWAISSDQIDQIGFMGDLSFRTGSARCDNKFAYHFAVSGWDIYNPFKSMMCGHAHSSGVRAYSKKDREIYGALAFVHPCDSPENPSELDICIMPLSSRNMSGVRMNYFLSD